MDATVNIVLEQRRPEELRSRAMLDRWQAAIGRGVAAVEKETLDGAVELGRLALACALEYLDLRLPDWAWRADHPRTAAWLTGFAARPSLRATAPV
jgi:glutathione S-transferase